MVVLLRDKLVLLGSRDVEEGNLVEVGYPMVLTLFRNVCGILKVCGDNRVS
jgi:hypothetical protein